MILQEVLILTNLRYFGRFSHFPAIFQNSAPGSDIDPRIRSTTRTIRPQEEYSVPESRGMRWASCELCGKWRNIPEDVILGAAFCCKDNQWDLLHASCEAEEDKEEGGGRKCGDGDNI
jgi:CW-type Zinc Finger